MFTPPNERVLIDRPIRASRPDANASAGGPAELDATETPDGVSRSRPKTLPVSPLSTTSIDLVREPVDASRPPISGL
jgi:hypothetical protein